MDTGCTREVDKSSVASVGLGSVMGVRICVGGGESIDGCNR